jgi:hypothetical protein
MSSAEVLIVLECEIAAQHPLLLNESLGPEFASVE